MDVQMHDRRMLFSGLSAPARPIARSHTSSASITSEFFAGISGFEIP